MKKYISLSAFCLLANIMFSQVQLEFDLEQQPASTNIEEMLQHNNIVYFSANDGFHGQELFSFDPQSGDLRLVADINPHAASSHPSELTEYGGKIYFQANDGESGKELWVHDPSTFETTLLGDLNPDGSTHPRDLTAYDGKLFFSCNSSGGSSSMGSLYSYDIANGQFNELLPPPSDSIEFLCPEHLTIHKEKLYFSGINKEFRKLLWRYDPETNLIDKVAYPFLGEEIKVYEFSMGIKNAFVYDEKLFINADTSLPYQHGVYLYTFDETVTPTR